MVLFDQDTHLIQEFGGMQSIPTTFLIDADGVIRRSGSAPIPRPRTKRPSRRLLSIGNTGPDT